MISEELDVRAAYTTRVFSFLSFFLPTDKAVNLIIALDENASTFPLYNERFIISPFQGMHSFHREDVSVDGNHATLYTNSIEK